MSIQQTRAWVTKAAGIAYWEAKFSTDHARRQIVPEFEYLYFFHIPKTAGTSFHFAFMGLGGERPADVFMRVWKGRLGLQAAQSGPYVFASSRELIRRASSPTGGPTIRCGRYRSTRPRSRSCRFVIR